MGISVGEPLYHDKGILLEGITYDHRNGNLYYIDIQKGLLVIISGGDSSRREIKIDTFIGVVGLTTDENVLVVGAHRDIRLFNIQTGATKVLNKYPDNNHFEGNELRSNEGAVTPDGKFWVGTMTVVEPGGYWGSMWNLDPDASLSKVWPEMTCIPNGLNWDLKLGRIYWTESDESSIYSFDYDAQTGQFDPRSKKLFYKGPEGCDPDGSCLDAEGNLYVCLWGGSKVARVNPHGQVDLEFDVPAANVTCCTFGGPEFDQLFITTAANDNDTTGRDLGGDVFKIDVSKYGIKGLPKFQFKLI